LATNIFAIYEKKPVSSSAIDSNDTQMNKTKIVKGLKLEFVDIVSINLVLSNKLKIIRINATTSNGKKKVSIVIFLILIIGYLIIHTNIAMIASKESIKTIIIFIT
jgi:hypothetical protein